MTQPLPRTGFHSSRFIRLLADLAIDGSTNTVNGEHSKLSKQSFAERLAQWLDLTAAIALSGTLHAKAGSALEASPRADDGLEAQLASVRGALAESITADGVLKPGKVRIKLPAPTAAADFAPYRRYYSAHQRDMEAGIGPLRASVRVALAKRSPALRQLAELDAVLDKVMSERERNLLATVPQLIEKRFEQLRAAHRQALTAAQQADDPAQWMLPGGWLARFCQDMQGVLLAELEVRLQAVMGMVEAFSNERQREIAETAETSSPLPPAELATATPGGALFS
jgi:hypothetical protein